MGKRLKELNKKLALDEIRFQYKYSSDLYDNLESRVHLALILVSIISGMLLGNRFILSRVSESTLPIKFLFLFGTLLIVYGLYHILFKFKRIPFGLLNLKKLGEKVYKDPKFDFYYAVGKRYTGYIDLNFKNYSKKQNHISKGTLILGWGLIVVIIVYVYYILT